MRIPLLAALLALVVALPVSAQPPPPPGTPPQGGRQAAPPERKTPPGTFTNIRLDLTITDTYGETPSTRTVTMLVMDGQRGSIRTSNRLPDGGAPVALNVDAIATLLPDQSGRIQLRLTFEYTPNQPEPTERRTRGPAELHESLTVVLQDGRKLVVSQSADPLTAQQVTVEVSATALK